MDQTDNTSRSNAKAALGRESLQHRAETQLLWSATEGQVVNAVAFALAVLLCWLVLPVIYAIYRYIATACHRYDLTDQRLLVRSGILVKQIESLELYRVKDITISGTLLQSLLGRGRIILMSTDTTSPRLVINAVPNPDGLSQLIREAVEKCRADKGVRAFDF
ncbi:MAG: PH domain-containing protein [Pseudolysinimonas sp.]